MTRRLGVWSMVLGAMLAVAVPLVWRWVKRSSNTQVHRINQ